MSASTTQALITGGLTDFGTSVVAVLTAVLVIGIGYLVFRFGWSKIKSSLR